MAAATGGVSQVQLDRERKWNERRTSWPAMHGFLTSAGFESTPPRDANEMVQSGDWVLVDLRPASRFDEAHPSGAVNVELYKETDLKNAGIKAWIRAVCFSSMGVKPVESNDAFLLDLRAAAGDRGVILMCDIGGTLIPNENFPHGKISRSLKAAYNLIADPNSGFSRNKVAHLKRGIYGWHLEGLPFDGAYDSAGIGRTPSVVEEEIFSYGRQTHIIEPSDMEDIQKPPPPAQAA